MGENEGLRTFKQLALVVHFHQPVGNLDSVVEHATKRCYRPFLELLERYEELPITLHYSGCLLEWMEANAPDVTLLLRRLVERDQVELMTGGFYEPILAALPSVDQVGQIEMLTTHLRNHYAAEPKGLWLSERVWEQDVVPAMTETGVRYTVVDDTMFHGVGITDEQLTGPFVTEHEGKPLLVYAGDRRLRYLVPYKRIERVIDHLRAAEDDRLFVYADDGEKFGEWPDTHERVYEKKWLARFFEELLAQRNWLSLVRLGDHSRTARPKGRVYLPSSSYDEMMTWALPREARLRLGKLRRNLQTDDPEGALSFLKGAPWRSFLAKYPEVNQLQKRMLHVSRQVHDAGAPEQALQELYRAQCNCAYWHGSFGGVYLGFMRSALWHHLMRAEGMVRGLASAPVVQKLDINADYMDEIIINAPWGAAVLAPHQGGSLIELDDWRVGANLLAVVARHREAYHVEDENPPDEENDEEIQVSQTRGQIDRDSLIFDEYGRGALIDILDGNRLTSPYDYTVDDGGIVTLWTATKGIKIAKQLTADAEELVATYTISNHSGRPFEGSFATETSVLPLNLGREVEEAEVESDHNSWRVSQAEAELGLEVGFSRPAEVTNETIVTASATLEGLKPMLQGVAVVARWSLDLPVDESFSVELRLRPWVNEKALTKANRGVSSAPS
ncbi:MAG: alpha-amylase/4-alpha-glucanotransferase domain-containing protein [Actinomycetota bacterium]